MMDLDATTFLYPTYNLRVQEGREDDVVHICSRHDSLCGGIEVTDQLLLHPWVDINREARLQATKIVAGAKLHRGHGSAIPMVNPLSGNQPNAGQHSPQTVLKHKTPGVHALHHVEGRLSKSGQLVLQA